MGEIKKIDGGITAPIGYSAAGVACGIKKSGGKDLAIVASAPAAKPVCMFTTNKVKAAPVIVSMQHGRGSKIGAIVINSGNANACTGGQGLEDATAMCELTAAALGLTKDKVLVASTGVIGVSLPMENVEKGITQAAVSLKKDGGYEAAEAIMTTDTRVKQSAVKITIGTKTVRIGGMAKGSGMIAPNMATMIAVITTDADICGKALEESVHETVNTTFNCITIDGDMSTNDTVHVLANSAAANTHILKSTHGYDTFKAGLAAVMADLAEQMVSDGEAATKFIKVTVKNAGCFEEAKQVAVAVAESVLVKCAFFGEDANWGRIAAAAGAAGVEFNQGKLDISLGGEEIMRNGEGVVYCAKTVGDTLHGRDIDVVLNLNEGDASATVLTTDLSVEFVKFNAHYRT